MHSLVVILLLTVQDEGLAKNEDDRPDYLSKVKHTTGSALRLSRVCS